MNIEEAENSCGQFYELDELDESGEESKKCETAT